MKISEAQQRVLDLMKEGYELGHYTGIYSNVRLQYNRLGSGTHTVGVNKNTFLSMRKNKLIVRSEERGYNLTVYKISEP